jgi:hypothetical protein
VAFEALTLANRAALAVADGAPVNGAQQRVLGRSLYAEFELSVTGGPTVEARAAIEGSADGTNWHQLVRFVDLAAAGKRIARLPGNAAASEAVLASSALNSANAASGVLVDGVLPLFLRAVTKLQTLSGGASPTATIVVRVSVK